MVRADAAFAKPEIYEALEARGVRYAISIPSNDVLEREVAELLRRPVGRPSHRPLVRYKSFRYQAASWARPRRVVAKVEFRYDELFPRVGFIVTNLETDNRGVVRFYNKRGTAERWIKAGRQAIKLTRLSGVELVLDPPREVLDDPIKARCSNQDGEVVGAVALFDEAGEGGGVLGLDVADEFAAIVGPQGELRHVDAVAEEVLEE